VLATHISSVDSLTQREEFLKDGENDLFD